MSFEQKTKPELVKEARELSQQLKEANARIKELETQVKTDKADEVPMVLGAVSLYRNKDKELVLATLKFNPETGDAKVDSLQPYKSSVEHKACFEAEKLLQGTFFFQREE